mmetsp:Transcript_64441/g.104259  ORF Transcript_64441/g.104259 Transcript_64441/m.104259 type:complete len:94 (+) Transcript_64441:69-350(+)
MMYYIYCQLNHASPETQYIKILFYVLVLNTPHLISVVQMKIGGPTGEDERVARGNLSRDLVVLDVAGVALEYIRLFQLIEQLVGAYLLAVLRR